MKKARRSLSLFLAVLMMLALAACSTPASSAPAESEAAPAESSEAAASESEAAPEGKTFKVGINNFGVANFFARAGKAGMEDELKKLGCEVVATVTDDVASRSDAIENFISQGCDAIIIEEGDINEVAPVCKDAKAAGIIIGSMDSGDADFVDVYVSSDNTYLGKVAAEQMVEAMGEKGKIVEIIFDGGSMIRARKEAMHEVISAYPDISIDTSLTYTWPDFYPDIKSKMESVLQANPNPGDISAVFASFDGVGIAAADAIREAGLQDSIVVVGIDGDPDAYAEMKKEDSPFIATMAQDPDAIARTCVQSVVDLLNGKTLPEKVIQVEGFLVTKDNIPETE